MSIAESLKAWRTLRHLTIEDLAERAALSPELVTEIESGEADPSASILANLATALSVAPPWLFADPHHLQLLLQHDDEEGDDQEIQREATSVDPVVGRILHALGQDRTLFTLVTVLLEAGDPRLIRAAEVSLRSLVKQVKPMNVPWVVRQPGNFEPPND